MVTNKTSNILEDLDTLHFIAKLVPEFCKALEEGEVLKNAFDLAQAFDEAVSVGYKERVTVQQVKQFTVIMESHDEIRHKDDMKKKMKKAKRDADDKRKQIDAANKNKFDGMGHGVPSPSFGSSGSGGSMGSNLGSSGGGGSARHTSAPYAERTERRPEPAPAASGGLKLFKSNKTSAAQQVLKEENTPDVEATKAAAGGSGAVHETAPDTDVQVTIEEKFSLSMDNDGGIENLDVKGGLFVEIANPACTNIKLLLAKGDNPAFQFKTHPLINSSAFADEDSLGLKDQSRPFPVNSKIPILRWHLVNKSDALIPLSISCWPSNSSEGLTYVTIEYELKSRLQLQDVTVTIPIPAGPPIVTEAGDGNTEYSAKERLLRWSLPVIEKSNRTGSLEFNVPTTNNSAFFPVQVGFSAAHTLCDIDITDVLAHDGGPTKFHKTAQLIVDDFTVTN